ncbi:hypothetical protein BOTBODRAFT_38030 [Botryobasidium botryosum FD-172 SS1]|uniref:Zn(2)-C6 fungal-type domain-containing protein n=1 Tax=Botryobasidium botryosum (strain FD-172 SS1) TaxID=930990 RepID=A0A067LYN7_BOTB1|nr:hypothetical protein BOTBODRAFT_38030 [Botryobasidium botryosum FD-172 SS1]
MAEAIPQQVLVLIRGKACAVCRIKKRKCDGVKPACGRCTRPESSDQCYYLASFPPRAKSNKCQLLEDRVEALKTQVDDALKTRNLPDSTTLSTARTAQPDIDTHNSTSCPALSRALRPSPLDTPISLRDYPMSLLKQKDLPSSVRDPLVNSYLKRKSHNWMTWSMPKLWAAYKLPSSDPESIHPALVDAMCLFGLLYSPPSVRSYEPLFYARLQRSLAESLSKVDRIHDFIRASALVTIYCYHRQRYATGQNHLAATIQLAVACGLDKIETCDMNTASISLLRPPRGAAELGDMVHTWWGLFCIDRISSTLLEYPTTIPENDVVIKTMWPCDFEDYASGRVTHAAHSGAASLRTRCDPTPATIVYDNVYAFRAKSMGLLYHAMTLTPSHKERNADQVRDIRTTIDVASQLSETMMAYRLKICPTFSCARRYENDDHDSILVFAMAACYAALIRLHSAPVDTNRNCGSYQRRLQLARDCVALGAEANSVDPALIMPTIIIAWCTSYEVFAWEVVRLNKLGESDAAAAALVEVEATMNLIRQLVQRAESLKKKWPVQNLQRFDIHKAELVTWSKQC